MEHQEQSEQQQSQEHAAPFLHLRMLVSRREAGAIIGHGGDNIAQIRERFGAKAGVSKVLDGAIDRILTVSGQPDQLASSVGFVAQLVTQSNLDTIQDCNAKGVNPYRLITYDHFPLKALNQRPNILEEGYPKVLFVRLMIPNSLIGALIGKSGARIQKLQQDNGVDMVISKGVLFNSTERLVDVQSVGNLDGFQNCIRQITEYLIEEMTNVTTRTLYYIPCGKLDSSVGNTKIDAAKHGKELIQKVSYPVEYIGSLIGKRGDKIQNVRKMSNCALAVDTEQQSKEGFRDITIIGTKSNIAKAIEMLNQYYEREKQRRKEGLTSSGTTSSTSS